MFSTNTATKHGERATAAPLKSPLDRSKDALDNKITNFQNTIKKFAAKENNHDEAMLLLEGISNIYLKEFQDYHKDFQTAVINNTAGLESEFDTIKNRLKQQFVAVNEIWGKHKSDRAFIEGSKARFIDNRIKDLFKTCFTHIKKATASSKPLSKSYSYTNHVSGGYSSSSPSFLDFMFPFVLGAMLL